MLPCITTRSFLTLAGKTTNYFSSVRALFLSPPTLLWVVFISWVVFSPHCTNPYLATYPKYPSLKFQLSLSTYPYISISLCVQLLFLQYFALQVLDNLASLNSSLWLLNSVRLLDCVWVAPHSAASRQLASTIIGSPFCFSFFKDHSQAVFAIWCLTIIISHILSVVQIFTSEE